MIGIGAAVLIVVVVIVIAAKLTGIFNLGSGSQKHPKTTVEASSEASESRVWNQRSAGFRRWTA